MYLLCFEAQLFNGQVNAAVALEDVLSLILWTNLHLRDDRNMLLLIVPYSHDVRRLCVTGLLDECVAHESSSL